MTTQPDQYAVVGNPIAHSKSPRIHALFAAQTGQHLEYRAILVEPGGFAVAARAFREAGGKGLNVTVPFKQDAWVFADLLSARAERAGAVNTLTLEPGGVRGDNTDGVGLVRDLTINHGYRLAGQRGERRGPLAGVEGDHAGSADEEARHRAEARWLGKLKAGIWVIRFVLRDKRPRKPLRERDRSNWRPEKDRAGAHGRSTNGPVSGDYAWCGLMG